ncbi:MAG: DUF3887 domain-containing protein [Eubacteriales bacterium]|nr:DUF3887 domain-containing protein [Eubacteriales bacterium]
MKKIRKVFAAMIVITLTAVLLAGCGDSNKLGENFDEEGVKKQAQEDITIGESGDFDAWKERFVTEVQGSLTQDIYDNYLKILEEKGEFEEFGKCAVIGQEQDGKKYAVAVCIVKHKNGDVKHTLAYDENMKLVQYVI